MNSTENMDKNMDENQRVEFKVLVDTLCEEAAGIEEGNNGLHLYSYLHGRKVDGVYGYYIAIHATSIQKESLYWEITRLDQIGVILKEIAEEGAKFPPLKRIYISTDGRVVSSPEYNRSRGFAPPYFSGSNPSVGGKFAGWGRYHRQPIVETEEGDMVHDPYKGKIELEEYVGNSWNAVCSGSVQATHISLPVPVKGNRIVLPPLYDEPHLYRKGAIIENYGKYVTVSAFPEYGGWACPTWHSDEEEKNLDEDEMEKWKNRIFTCPVEWAIERPESGYFS